MKYNKFLRLYYCKQYILLLHSGTNYLLKCLDSLTYSTATSSIILYIFICGLCNNTVSNQNYIISSNGESYPVTGLDRPLSLQEVEAVRISRLVVHEGSRVVRPVHQMLLSPRRYNIR